MDKLELSALLAGLHSRATAMENSMNGAQKIKNRAPYASAMPLLDIYANVAKAGSGRDICTLLVIAALVTIAMREKQPRSPLEDERINKM